MYTVKNKKLFFAYISGTLKDIAHIPTDLSSAWQKLLYTTGPA